ncbi:MAG: DUF933 domain-containing protein [Planctomycetota bacterium]|nr:DUF933 domain-containing protein [Planctomycetota bacterium]
MRIALVGLPGSGKTTLYNALVQKPADVLPGVPGSAPHVSMLTVRDPRLEWLRDLYSPKKYTPATLQLEDHPGIPPGLAKSDRRGELFGRMRDADGLVITLRSYATDAYAYDDPDVDPGRDLELVALEFLNADLDICERRLRKLDEEWKRPKERDRVERERSVVRRLRDTLLGDKGAHAAGLSPEEEQIVRGFQLLTAKPVVLLANLAEDGTPPELPEVAFNVLSRFDACAALEVELAQLEGNDRAAFAEELGLSEPLVDRFPGACYRGLGLRSFFTVGEDEVRAWTITGGSNAVQSAAKVHSDLARGFIRAEVTPYEDLRSLGGMKEVKAKGKQRLEGKGYVVADGDILNIRFSV